jgi:hypothetical protein
MRRIVVLVGLLSACSFAPPSSPTPAPNSAVVQAPRDSALSVMVRRLEKSSFVIDTPDRSSGTLDVEYSGKPGGYLDCGTYEERVGIYGSATGEHIEFPAASAYERFQIPAGSGRETRWVTWKMTSLTDVGSGTSSGPRAMR